jgi:alkylation response protein AidB-like acyl-CoA dehydrogenase
MDHSGVSIVDGGLGERYEAVRSSTRALVSKELVPLADDLRTLNRITGPAADVLGRSKIIGTMIPENLGGLGMDCLARLVSIEEAARISPDIGAFLQIAQLGTMALLEFGTKAQQAEWLPRLASGQRICTIAITEERGGSHISACQTSYQRKRGHIVLNGEKWFIGNAPIADLHVVLARDGDSGELSTLIVDGLSEGVDNTCRHETRGLRGFPWGKLVFRNVLLPVENVVGGFGAGQAVAHRVIERHGRLSLTGLALGIHQKIFECTMDYAKNRKLYGCSITSLSDVRARIFDIYCQLEQGRCTAYRAAALECAGRKSGPLLALAKRLNSEYACKSAMIAAEIFGARANLPEYPIGQLLQDAMMTMAPSGTSDILRKRILQDIFRERQIAW